MYNMNDLIDLVQSECRDIISPDIYLAKVVRAYPDLEITFKGIRIYTEQINLTSWVTYLIKGFTTQGSNSHSHSVKLNGINVGDTVLVKSLGDKVIILDKVVE